MKEKRCFQNRRCVILLSILFLLLLNACQSVPVASGTNEPINVTETPEITPEITAQATSEPTVQPTQEPTKKPTDRPTVAPTPEPTAQPTQMPTPEPTLEQTPEITLEVTGIITGDGEETELEKDKKSILGFLKIAMQPVGQTMYVWGGGWNEEDTGAGVEAVTLGVSPAWAEFATKQDETYNYQETKFQIHDGLDCSGYVGWAVYNVLETENGKEGYVLSSAKMAENYAARGLGDYLTNEEIVQWKPGDIVSMKKHVWICIGMCEDGSVLVLHATLPGVYFCGTNLPDGSKSQAVVLAEHIMQTYYPDWYAKYPNCARSHTYLTDSVAMRWSRTVLSDEEQLMDMSANEVISVLFEER